MGNNTTTAFSIGPKAYHQWYCIMIQTTFPLAYLAFSRFSALKDIIAWHRMTQTQDPILRFLLVKQVNY